ncbi:DUF4082 domain-containing protein [Microbacterium kunmingense]|uniref:DUF4082 domain-containing protein n=1 Tax=Microbacterium kunmingense TaxID=2915939 RepID=UPI003D72A900
MTATVASFVGAILTADATAAATTAVGVLSDTATPQILVSPITGRGEVGLQFSPETSGSLSGVQFYQNASNSGVTSASVWSSAGERLATVAVNPSAPIGWRTVPVDVQLEAGATYTVSVYDSNGRPPVTENAFATALTVNGLSTPAGAGVYSYAGASLFPATPSAYSFMVDPMFTPDPAPTSPVEGPTEPTEEPVAEPTPPPPPPPAALTTARYGPDGTHWPTNTPRADEARVVNVAPTWSAISNAIKANANLSDPVVICVAPGELVGGNGAGSSSRGVIENVGNAQRASRILVSACDGVGTVKTVGDKGISFVGVKGVSIVGIDFSAQPVMIRNAQSFGLGYTVVPTLLVTGNGGNDVRDVDIVEVVAGVDARVDATGDRVEVKSADGSDIDGVRFVGFYAAPNYKVKGSRAHIDTVQFVTTAGDGLISNVVFDDAAVFMSSNQGIIAGANKGGSIVDSAFFGGTTGQLRYPVYAAGYQIVAANMLHGTWSDLKVAESVVAGSIATSYSFTEVLGSWSAKGDRGFQKLTSLTLEDIDRIAPMPTPEFLASIW